MLLSKVRMGASPGRAEKAREARKPGGRGDFTVKQALGQGKGAGTGETVGGGAKT